MDQELKLLYELVLIDRHKPKNIDIIVKNSRIIWVIGNDKASVVFLEANRKDFRLQHIEFVSSWII